MNFEEKLYINSDVDISEEHFVEKEKRLISREKQKHHMQHLLNELSYCGYKPSA